ncbi:MAG: hypothetical protein AAGA67_09390 [Cyanobacteria bacterium P01_F01_bin.153]
MAEFLVTNKNNSGPGSLRDAIAQANNNAAGSLDTFVFSPTEFNTPSDVIVLTGLDIPVGQPLIIRGNGDWGDTVIIGCGRFCCSGLTALQNSVFAVAGKGADF